MTASLSGTAAPGLSAAEARRRLLAHGPNALPEAARTPGWLRPARQFRSPLVLLLFALAFDLATWLVQGAADLGRWGTSLEATRSPVFLYTALGPLAFAYPARRVGARPLPNPAVHLSIVVCAALTAGTLLLPWLREALGLVPLDASLWLAVGAAALVWGVAEHRAAP